MASRIRIGVMLAAGFFIAFPIVVLLLELTKQPRAWLAWSEYERIFALMRNTSTLVLGTVAIALPTGFVAALIFYRSDLPGRRTMRQIVVFAMFVPMPLLATAWQAALRWIQQVQGASDIGSDPATNTAMWTAWHQGFVGAIVIHAVAALPWVIWLVGQAMRWIERGLEEEALTAGGVWCALRCVVIPRTLPALALATFWIALQTANDITITDLMRFRTFAEEVYAQFTRPDPGTGYDSRFGLVRATAVAVPPSLLVATLGIWVIARWQQRLPPLGQQPPPEWPLIRLKKWTWPTFMGGLVFLGILVGVPIVGLVWRCGNLPPDDHWSATETILQLQRALDVQGNRIAMSLLFAALTGFFVSVFAVAACWIARHQQHWLKLLVLGSILLWALPGPVVGVMLKETINQLMNFEDWISNGRLQVVRDSLYNGPSPLPVMWATGLRFLPIAMAMVWPVVQAVPRESHEAAVTDGATSGSYLRHVVFPAMRWATFRASVIVAALSMGDLGAGKLVETPGGQSFAHEIFTQMHTGVGNHLAAMCLILLAGVGLLGGMLQLWPHPRRNFNP